jgi:ribonuclease E
LGKKVMLINATDSEEIRVALLKDGVLSDFDIEFVHNEKLKGNIYKAKVIRVDQSLQAAFVHYGGQKNGFLPMGELPRDLAGPDGRRGRIQDLIQKDQEIMVQVIREELGTKGAMVTAQVSLPGRYLVLTPGNAVNGISRKIEEREDREHFRGLVEGLDVPAGMGVIVRTASLGVTKEDFEKDLGNLLDTYKEVQESYRKRQGAGLVWQEDDVVTRTLRDTWAPDIGEVHIDDHDTFLSAQAFFRRTMPQHLGALHHYSAKKPIFSKFQTEEQIERIYARRVPLPSGGAIVLDQTEALVAIDVNSGKTAGDNQEDTALRANLEAAEAIASHLRLRDLAGLIAIDFIDMKRETNNKAVMDRLVECLRHDRARMEVGKINRFGVLVMTRQRIRPSIQHVTHETCPVCQGTGQVKNAESLVLSVLRRAKSALVKNGVAKLSVRLAPPIAMNLLNQRRQELAELEAAHGASITVTPDHGVVYGDMAMDVTKKEEEPEGAKRAEPHERHEQAHDAENETVVLDGDAPISFDKALQPPDAAGRTDRRTAQRAALDERERLRSLFEKQKDGGDQAADAAKERRQKAEGPARGRRRPRGASGGQAEVAGASGAPAQEPRASGAPAQEPRASGAPAQGPMESGAPAPQKAAADPGAAHRKAHAPPARQYEPPKLSAEVIASLAIPTRPQRLSSLTATAPPDPPAEKARGRKAKAAPGGAQGGAAKVAGTEPRAAGRKAPGRPPRAEAKDEAKAKAKAKAKGKAEDKAKEKVRPAPAPDRKAPGRKAGGAKAKAAKEKAPAPAPAAKGAAARGPRGAAKAPSGGRAKK